MKKLVTICAVVGLVLAVSGAQATAINGSIMLNPFNISGTAPNINFGSILAQQGTGDFTVVPSYPNMTWLSASNPLNIDNPTGWTFGSATFGTWATTSGIRTGNYVELQGTFTPGTMFGGLTQSPGIVGLSFIMSGNTFTNASGSMIVTPEPMTLALLGLGGLLLRRKKA